MFIRDLDVDEHKEEGDTAGRPAWMIQVQHTTGAWLKSLPKVDLLFFRKFVTEFFLFS